MAARATSNAIYRELFESFDHGVTFIDMIFDEHGKGVDYIHRESNSALEKITGLRDIEGKRVTEVLPYIEPDLLEIYGRVARTGVPERFEHTVSALGLSLDLYAQRVGGEGSSTVVVVYTEVHKPKRTSAAKPEAPAGQDINRAVRIEVMGNRPDSFVFTKMDRAQNKIRSLRRRGDVLQLSEYLTGEPIDIDAFLAPANPRR